MQVTHISTIVKPGFTDFTNAFEKLAGRITKSDVTNIVTDPEGTRRHIETLQGYQDLIIFDIQDHGSLFNLIGEKRFAKQYLIGNPLIAFSMTRHDIRAALYAPLRVLVYTDGQNRTTIEYDKPSDLFGQFGIPQITEVGLGLDQKVEKLVEKAVEDSVSVKQQ
ncbi:DUF302 domain-containing protein [Mucilaginibacter conchicola]|uniref:DUF302 domain-containing protein n=1 Tax=Mucilaginibacter conchicola TaxID=2303333 RepID=A0A372NPS2_9SPHI|nr:DUF302 domain-containing protein [Mucilaginibacter conchicola]RFZ90939.1 DUF302 domain-containing protein [Mucilaginibacter conchicola]